MSKIKYLFLIYEPRKIIRREYNKCHHCKIHPYNSWKQIKVLYVLLRDGAVYQTISEAHNTNNGQGIGPITQRFDE